jgi:hypothetical protein
MSTQRTEIHPAHEEYELSRGLVEHAHRQCQTARHRADAARREAEDAERVYHTISENHVAVVDRLKRMGIWTPR